MFNFNVPDNLKTYGSRFALGGVLAAIGVGIVKIIKEGNEPIETIYEVQSRTWTRTTDISKRKLVKESDWKAPTGAKILDTRWEFKEMKKVPSGIDANGNTTYKEVAEYATKYYYEIYKWVFDRRRTASDSERFFGDTMAIPRYPDPDTLGEDEKVSGHSAHYTAVLRNTETGELKTFPLEFDIWNSIGAGSRVIVTTTKWAPNSVKKLQTIA